MNSTEINPMCDYSYASFVYFPYKSWWEFVYKKKIYDRNHYWPAWNWTFECIPKLLVYVVYADSNRDITCKAAHFLAFPGKAKTKTSRENVSGCQSKKSEIVKCAILSRFRACDVKVLSELLSNRYPKTRKPNKIKGLALFSFHCRDTIYVL